MSTYANSCARFGIAAFTLAGELEYADRSAKQICDAAIVGRGAPGAVLAPFVINLMGDGVALGTTYGRTIQLVEQRCAKVTATRLTSGIICLLEEAVAATPKDPLAVAEVLGLTPREAEIAMFAIKGLGNKEIARAIKRSPITVKIQLSRAYKKVGVSSRTELAALILRLDAR